VFKGLANPGDLGEHRLWVKCITFAECKTDITAVLTVKSGLDPHMIIELKDDLNLCSCLWLLLLLSFTYFWVNGINLYLVNAC